MRTQKPPPAEQRANLFAVILGLAAALLLASRCRVLAQYDRGGGGGGYNYGGGAYGGGHESADGYETMDDRPKVNLGIRLRIPAFKFELPRFSLPKITVSAKIRQPDGPRVIHLPEINFDTSSKIEPPNKGGNGGYGGRGGGGGGGGGYSSSQSQYQPSYGGAYGGNSYGGSYAGGEENSSMFTFSTSEEARPQSYAPTKASPYAASQYGPATSHAYQRPAGPAHYPQQAAARQPAGYSATNARPAYQVYSRPAGDARAAYQYRVEPAGGKKPELGFGAPAVAQHVPGQRRA